MNLKTSAGRKRLQGYREPHWEKFPAALLKGGSVGFRRSPETGAETWHVRVYVDGLYHKSNLGPVRPGFEYKEAFRAALDWARTIRDAGPVAAQEYTLEEVLDEYLLHLQGNSSSRNLEKCRQATKRLDALVPPELRKRKMSDQSFTQRDVTAIQRAYQQRRTLQGQPISPDSVNRIMAHFIAALNHGYRNKLIATNDAWKHYQRLPEEANKRRSKEYIKQNEREAFINACPAALRAFVMAMHCMAARPSEVSRLRVDDVDLKTNEVRLTTYKGKGSQRMFPLPEGTVVRKLFETQIEGKQSDDYVFTTEKGQRWQIANLAKLHNKVRDAGAFGGAFETYVWRHCRISDWARSNFPAPEVARLAGTSLEHIQKNYYKPDTKIGAAMAGL